MVAWFEEEGLVSDSAPVVAVGANAGNPHYLPMPGGSQPILPDEVLLFDLWGKVRSPGAVYADITWVAMTAAAVPPEPAAAFRAIAGARDAAVQTVVEAARSGRDLRGFEVDRAARGVLESAGYGDRILHRTGHSLGQDVHGNGVHMDDYETHDERRVLPGTGFTVEPGLYFETFGVRTEINVFRGDADARVTGPVQDAIVPLR
jgi:Xaa-Pro aminopeptidase